MHHAERTYLFHVTEAPPSSPGRHLCISFPRLIEEQGRHGAIHAQSPEQEEWLQAYLRSAGLAWACYSVSVPDMERWLELILRMPGARIVPGALLFEDQWITSDDPS